MGVESYFDWDGVRKLLRAATSRGGGGEKEKPPKKKKRMCVCVCGKKIYYRNPFRREAQPFRWLRLLACKWSVIKGLWISGKQKHIQNYRSNINRIKPYKRASVCIKRRETAGVRALSTVSPPPTDKGCIALVPPTCAERESEGELVR